MKARLGDYIREYSVRNKANENIPVYSVTNSQGFCKDYFGKEVASKDKSTYKIVPKGCFAYNPSRINVGSVDWQRNEEKVIVSPLYNVFSVSPELDNQYLYYFLKSDIALWFIKSIATGSVRDNLKLSMLYEFPINLPNIEKQKEIVSTLDTLQSIITHRRTQLEKLDLLVKARFVEMFGNPVSNPMNWSKMILKELSTKIGSGATPKGGKESYGTEGISLIRSMNVHNGVFEYKDLAYISNEQAEKLNNVTIESDDVLLNITGASVARCCIVPNEILPARVNQHVCVIRCKDIINPIFLNNILIDENYQELLWAIAGSGATREAITKQQVENLSIILPPLELQTQFADFVKQVDKSKATVQKALDEAQLLFDSLMQEYFG